MVRVVYDYYPYGLTWENPKLPTDPNAVHDHAYQDKEFQFAEFTNGHGLALYDFHARMYDPATARWLVPDPAAQFANPYLAMGNNPVVGVDPDGRFVIAPIIIGAAIGAFIGGMQADRTGGNWVKGAITGAFMGALGGVLGQIPIMSQGFGFLRGALSGSVNGLVGGGITGGVNALLTNQNVFRGIISGAATGAVFGGVFGGIQGVRQVNYINAKIKGESYFRKIDGALVYTETAGQPYNLVLQNGPGDCLLACMQMIDESYGGDINQDVLRNAVEGDPNLSNPTEIVYAEYDYLTKGTHPQVAVSDNEHGNMNMYEVFENVKDGYRGVASTRFVGPLDTQGHASVVSSVSRQVIVKQSGEMFYRNYQIELLNPRSGFFNTFDQRSISQGLIRRISFFHP
jgi:RHS repeat-associated protein